MQSPDACETESEQTLRRAIQQMTILMQDQEEEIKRKQEQQDSEDDLQEHFDQLHELRKIKTSCIQKLMNMKM